MKRVKVGFVLVCCIVSVCDGTDSFELHDDHLQRYEPLNYDTDKLHARHQRSSEKASLHFSLRAFGKYFPLRLRRDTTLFVNIGQQKDALYGDIWYKGEVTGVRASSVHGAVIAGVFRGVIHLPGETTYHVESSERIFRTPVPFHSVIYDERDYIWGNDSLPQCGANHGQGDNSTGPNDLKQQYSKLRENEKTKPIRRSDRNSQHRATEHVQDVYMTEAHRRKRSTKDFSESVCKLSLLSDVEMWKFMMNKYKTEVLAKYEILNLFASHVQELNRIFGQTIFVTNSDENEINQFTGIKFKIGQTKIMKPADCEGSKKFLLCEKNLDSDHLLKAFMKDDFTVYNTTVDDYDNYNDIDTGTNGDYLEEPSETDTCLYYLFTARVLDTFRLGLANSASVGKGGGVCDQYFRNTGFVTILLNSDKDPVFPVVSKLVFSHEVGHSFGAQHDDDMKKCPDFTVDDDLGYNLMFSKAQDGRKPNNCIFSNCSRQHIGQILNDKEHTKCFVDSDEPICGNNIVEEGEECDCGIAHYCTDSCCIPRGGYPGHPEMECHLREGKACSPSQGPCCNSSCQFIGQSEQVLCSTQTTCADQAFCHGEMHGVKCSQPKFRVDGTYCSNFGRICTKGECMGSICSVIGWRECELSNSKEKPTREEKEELCYMACQKKRSSECVSTHLYNKEKHPELHNLITNYVQQQNMTNYNIRLPTGFPCNKMQGYCDVFHRCRGVEPDTPLARLKRFLFSGNILKTYWWAVLLLLVALVPLSCGIIKCFSVHTRSDNPKAKPARPITETLHRLSSVRHSVRDSLDGIRHSIRNSAFLQSGSKTRNQNVSKADEDIPLQDIPLQEIEEGEA